MNPPPKIENGLDKLFKQVVFAKPRHVFGAQTRVFIQSCDQVERSCAHCGLVRITVMQGCGRREYRHFNGCQFMADVEPECVGVLEVKAGAA